MYCTHVWSHADARFTRHLPPTLLGLTNSKEAKLADYDLPPLNIGGRALGGKQQSMWKRSREKQVWVVEHINVAT